MGANCDAMLAPRGRSEQRPGEERISSFATSSPWAACRSPCAQGWATRNNLQAKTQKFAEDVKLCATAGRILGCRARTSGGW